MTAQEKPTPPPPAPPKKLPYEKPVLRRLGNVRELTGANPVGSVTDGVHAKPRG